MSQETPDEKKCVTIPAFPPIKDNKDFLFVTQGLIILDGPICDESVSNPIEQILLANAVSNMEHVTLMINSQGGSVTSAFALIDMIKGSKIPIHTVGYGQVMSSGLLIFMSGSKGDRVLLPNTLVLSHQYTAGFGMHKEHDAMANHVNLRRVGKQMRKHYVECTGLDVETIDSHLLCATDTWLTPHEAVKYNLADKVIKKIIR